MPLFPEIQPYATHMLPVGDNYQIYIEESGNPTGLPVIVLHGGPGSGFSATTNRRFNPQGYRIMCFDQRGAGRSTPSGSLEANTTAHLVEDIAAIIAHFKLPPVVLYGTSWGSTLALAFAQAHPQAVAGLVIGGIFLGTQAELDWVNLPTGMPQFRWSQYQDLLTVLPSGQIPSGKTLETSLLSLVTGSDPSLAKKAASAYATYECSGFFPQPDMEAIRAFVGADEHITAHVGIELHYFANACFLAPHQLLQGCHRISHLPVAIVQGGLDFVCPPATAHKLHAVLPNSTLTVVPSAGHIADEAMEEARIVATNTMLSRLSA